MGVPGRGREQNGGKEGRAVRAGRRVRGRAVSWAASKCVDKMNGKASAVWGRWSTNGELAGWAEGQPRCVGGETA